MIIFVLTENHNQNQNKNLSDHIHSSLAHSSFNDTMGPHANQDSKWRGAEGTWIYIETQRPCCLQDKGPWEQVTVGRQICLCGGREDPAHGNINNAGPFAYDLCVKGRVGTVAWVSWAHENLNQSFLWLRTIVQHTHTHSGTLRSMHTHIYKQRTHLSGVGKGIWRISGLLRYNTVFFVY